MKHQNFISKTESGLAQKLSGGIATSFVALLTGCVCTLILLFTFSDFAAFKVQEVRVSTTVLWILAALLAFASGLWCSRSKRSWGAFFTICFLGSAFFIILGTNDMKMSAWGWFSVLLVGGSFILAYRLTKPPVKDCLLYTSPSPRDATLSRMPSSA